MPQHGQLQVRCLDSSGCSANIVCSFRSLRDPNLRLRIGLVIGFSSRLERSDPLLPASDPLPARAGSRGNNRGRGATGEQQSLRRPPRRELAELERALSEDERTPCRRSSSSPASRASARRRLFGELISGRRGGRDTRVIGGACIELGDDELPYAPLVAALRPLLRDLRPAPRGALRARPRAELARLDPEIGEPSTEPESERGEAQRRLFDAFLELISGLGEERRCCSGSRTSTGPTSSTRSFLRFLAASLQRASG